MTTIRGGSNIREDPDLLRGVLAGEGEALVYTEDSCLECEREGRAYADDKCWHRHWATADALDSRERRG